MILDVYTDCSYCTKTRVAACGFIVLHSNQLIKHTVIMVGEIKNSTQGESYAIGLALEYLLSIPSVREIYIHTDSKAMVTLKRKREVFRFFQHKMEAVYAAGISINLKWVKGHAKNLHNNMVDVSSRTQLRRWLKAKAA